MRTVTRLSVLALLALLAIGATGCQEGGEIPTATSTPAPTGTTTSTATGTPAPSATSTATTTPAPSTTSTATPSASPPPGAVVAANQAFELVLGESARLDGTDRRIALEGVVNDSRCPVDVVCIRAGDVTVQLTLTDGGEQPQQVAIRFGEGEATAGVPGAEIEVLAVQPEPVSTRPILPEDYRVTLVWRPAPVVTSGIDGLVTIGPQCPVAREDQPCPDLPYSALLIVLDAGDREVARVTSGADGRFSVDLPSGEYVIDPQSPPGRPLPAAGRIEVTVAAGARSYVEVPFDTGIR